MGNLELRELQLLSVDPVLIHVTLNLPRYQRLRGCCTVSISAASSVLELFGWSLRSLTGRPLVSAVRLQDWKVQQKLQNKSCVTKAVKL